MCNYIEIIWNRGENLTSHNKIVLNVIIARELVSIAIKDDETKKAQCNRN